MTQSNKHFLSILSDIERDEKQLVKSQRILARGRTVAHLHRYFSTAGLRLFAFPAPPVVV